MFKQYKRLAKADAEATEREALADRVCDDAHRACENRGGAFDPAAREADADADLLDEAEVEHATAKELITQLEAMSPDENLYDAKVKVLGVCRPPREGRGRRAVSEVPQVRHGPGGPRRGSRRAQDRS